MTDRQLSMFELKTGGVFGVSAQARRRDPETSRQAAESLNRSGRIHQQAYEVLRAVSRIGDRTSAEIADGMGIDRHVPARRLSELVKAGLVEITGRRRCRMNNTNAQTYRATERGEHALRQFEESRP